MEERKEKTGGEIEVEIRVRKGREEKTIGKRREEWREDKRAGEGDGKGKRTRLGE